jgi:hypothetical protein
MINISRYFGLIEIILTQEQTSPSFVPEINLYFIS